jgi:hypothetical protein
MSAIIFPFFVTDHFTGELTPNTGSRAEWWLVDSKEQAISCHTTFNAAKARQMFYYLQGREDIRILAFPEIFPESFNPPQHERMTQ